MFVHSRCVSGHPTSTTINDITRLPILIIFHISMPNYYHIVLTIYMLYYNLFRLYKDDKFAHTTSFAISFIAYFRVDTTREIMKQTIIIVFLVIIALLVDTGDTMPMTTSRNSFDNQWLAISIWPRRLSVRLFASILRRTCTRGDRYYLRHRQRRMENICRQQDGLFK